MESLLGFGLSYCSRLLACLRGGLFLLSVFLHEGMRQSKKKKDEGQCRMVPEIGGRFCFSDCCSPPSHLGQFFAMEQTRQLNNL